MSIFRITFPYFAKLTYVHMFSHDPSLKICKIPLKFKKTSQMVFTKTQKYDIIL